MNKIVKIYLLLIEKLYRLRCRLKIKNQNFTIISNDCWGGRVYLDLGLEYNSPTVNLFFYSPCFIKLISNLKEYLNSDLTFKNKSIYETANKDRIEKKLSYPIGILKDIEIHFLHSKDEYDAKTKWDKRLKRVNYENLYFKFSDAYLIDKDDLVMFDNLPFKNKVCFTATSYPSLKNNIYIKDFKGDGFVLDPFKYRWKYRKYFDVIRWLNK